MKIDNCELVILHATRGYELNEPNGRVEMNHGDSYAIRVLTPRRADVVISIDGKEIGIFRTQATRGNDYMLTLQRPPNDTGRFTFYNFDSDEGRETLKSVPISNMGLVVAEIYLEKQVQKFRTLESYDSGERSVTRGFGGVKGASVGGTGLSGYSSQKFTSTNEMEYENPNNPIVLTLRLVGANANLSKKDFFNLCRNVLKRDEFSISDFDLVKVLNYLEENSLISEHNLTEKDVNKVKLELYSTWF